MKILVKKGGPLTTLQDLGRYGYQKFGVLVSGAMDDVSLRLSNPVSYTHLTLPTNSRV